MDNKITRAIYKAISEKVIKQLVWDESIQKYVLPEGFILSVDEPVARLAANDLGITLKVDEPLTHMVLNEERIELPSSSQEVVVDIERLISADYFVFPESSPSNFREGLDNHRKDLQGRIAEVFQPPTS